MERLTMESDRGGTAFTFSLNVTCMESEIRKIKALGKRLKEYEDTGLEPEEINKIKSGWILFKLEPDKDGRETLTGHLPENNQEILVTDGKRTWFDTFFWDGYCYLDSNFEFVKEAIAWMPLPEPYKEEAE